MVTVHVNVTQSDTQHGSFTEGHDLRSITRVTRSVITHSDERQVFYLQLDKLKTVLRTPVCTVHLATSSFLLLQVFLADLPVHRDHHLGSKES